MKTDTVNPNAPTDKNLVTELFIESGLSILGFLVLLLLIA